MADGRGIGRVGLVGDVIERPDLNGTAFDGTGEVFEGICSTGGVAVAVALAVVVVDDDAADGKTGLKELVGVVILALLLVKLDMVAVVVGEGTAGAAGPGAFACAEAEAGAATAAESEPEREEGTPVAIATMDDVVVRFVSVILNA